MAHAVVSQDRLWDLADAAYRKASDAALLATRKALPEGRVVTWMHGERCREGVVVAVHGFQYGHTSVRVRSTVSGKVYDVDAPQILSVLRARRVEGRG